VTNLLTPYAPLRLITRGLVAHYDFKAGAGGNTLYDLTPGNRHGTLQAGPLWSNGGIAFDGSTQYVTRGSEIALGSAMHAMGVANISSLAAQAVIGGRSGSTSTRTWLALITTTGVLQAQARTTATVNANAPGTVSAGTWFFWEMYYDGANVAARLNNSGAYTTAALTGTLSNTGTWNLARCRVIRCIFLARWPITLNMTASSVLTKSITITLS
jgi:hypothetical protein